MASDPPGVDDHITVARPCRACTGFQQNVDWLLSRSAESVNEPAG
jgi:hypothetical protein